MFNKYNNWVLLNLLKFGNSLVPKDLMKKYKKEDIEKRIKQIIKEDVVIAYEESNYCSEAGIKAKDINCIVRVIKK